MFSEITDAVALTDGRRLNPNAVGWTRQPLHRTHLCAPARSKRWEYWGVITERFVLGLTIADLSYAHLTQVYAYDRHTQQETIADTLGLGPLRPGLSDDLPPMTATCGPITFTDVPEGTRLRVDRPDIQVDLLAATGGESLGVVVPWSPTRFQYTLKDLNRAVTGQVTVAAQTENVGAGWAVLDRGRGVWPYSMTWNWGTGNGVVDGTHLGLQVGGKWTDGTGATENALFVEGRLHPWPDPLVWTYDLSDPGSPWRVSGPQVDAVLEPFHRRRAVTNTGIIAARTHQAFGTWSGWAEDSDGVRHRLDGLVGWAEEARNRW